MNLSSKTKEVWDNAEDCKCGIGDCEFNDKLCGICKDTIVYTAHQSNQPNSSFAWNIDHIIPKSKFVNFAYRYGVNDIKNLQAVHVKCNQQKGNGIII